MVENIRNERRKYLRFNPMMLSDNNDAFDGQSVLAFISWDTAGKEFEPQDVAFIVEEGHKGCGLVFVKRGRAESSTFPWVGAECLLKVGKLHPLRSVVRWVREYDEDVAKVGFEYLE